MGRKSRQYESFALSHRGLVRQNNEDHVRVIALKKNHGARAILAVLADGVGGHQAGEIASKIATDTIISEVSMTHPATDVHSQLDQSILSANKTILENAEKYPERSGMGTTCVCALVIGRKLYAAHLGDSRLYLHRKHKLYQLTRDHTIYEDILHLNKNNPQEQNRNHPMAHVLSRYLGSPKALDIDHELMGFDQQADTLKLRSGDILLLCSDGITDLISDKEIENILSICHGRKCAQFLILRALENGGYDNASVIVIKIP